ncbi:MAG: hypothetical protein A2Z31_08990 [candidate division NC10 bacterium RBG_16_65_8]|nr:MAG: hypothetical protein A2Z31_08990 [candidate division NC10 bacterium RBG_16_65_8]
MPDLPGGGTVYDHTPEQVWRHLDTCQCRTYVHARLPRTACPTDGVKQVPAPWAEARSQFTRLFETRVIDTCKECDVAGVTRLLETSWDATWGVLTRAVARGLARKVKRVPARLGIDEKAVGKGQDYESLVCDLDRGTVVAVVEERTQASLESYYRQFTAEELRTIRAIAMDMWERYILAAAACVPDAAQKIVFDRYHATRYVKNEAAGSLNLDLVRDNRSQVEADQHKTFNAYPLRSRKVEAIQVHHLVPGRHEVIDKLLLRVRASVDFSQGAELGV